MTETGYELVNNGDSAITIIFERPISKDLSRIIITIAEQIKIQQAGRFEDIIPGYQSLTLCYESTLFSESKGTENNDELQQIITPIIEYHLTADIPSSKEHYSHRAEAIHHAINSEATLIEIPVCYEDEYALDQQRVLQHTGLTSEQLIAIHSEATYLVHMLGFMPGFLYLGGLDNRLHCPRKDVPATRIPAGSIAIGGQHTGVYPASGPGGWNIIGRTPLRLFKPDEESPFVASALDNIRFVAISKNQFLAIVKSQEYQEG